MVYSADGGGLPSQPAIIYASSTRPTAISSGQASRSSGGSSTNRAGSVQRRNTKKKQTTTVRDTASGAALVANDASGFGLKRPYLPWNVYATNLETAPGAAPVTATSSGTFVSLLTVASEPQHPKVRVRYIAVTGAGTSGELRLLDRTSGQVLDGPDVIGTATSVEGNLDGTLVNPTLTGAGAPMKVDVQARVTAGGATIGVLVVYALGIGT